MVITEVNSVKITSTQQFYEVADTIENRLDILADGKHFNIYKRNRSLGIEVMDRPPNNIRLGLDLAGGTRIVIRPVTESGTVTKNETEQIRKVLTARMNTYGLSDVSIRSVEDYEHNWYLQVEMAGSGSERIIDVVRHIGKFDVRILNKTIFSGDSIVAVGTQSAMKEGGYGVPFTVKKEAALNRAA